MYRVHSKQSPTINSCNNSLPLRTVSSNNVNYHFAGLFFLFLAIHFPSVSFATFLNLPKDTNGWTVFAPSVDTDVVYIDSVTGNDATCRSYRTSDSEVGADPFNPIGNVLPCATVNRAWGFTGESQPDWFLFKRGSVFNSGIELTRQKGRSVTEPRVFASYGPSGAMPVFREGFANNGNDNTEYLAISGLDFYRDTRDPASPNYSPAGQGTTGIFFFSHESYHQNSILIEGCRVRFFLNNANIAPSSLYGNSGLTFRRNVILDAYSYQEGHSQGILISNIDGVVFEENILDHNGWLVQSNGDGTTGEGEATIFNHNAYLTNNKNMTVRNNLFVRGSSNNTKIKYSYTGFGTGLTVYNNLYLGGEIALSIGAPDEHQNYSTVSPTVDGNVWLNPGKWNPTKRGIAWFFYNFNWDGGVVSNNFMLNQDDDAIGGMFFHLQYSGRNVEIKNNIVHNAKNIVSVQLDPIETGNFDREGFLITNNIFNDLDSYIVYAGLLPDLGAYSFSGNKYNSTKTVDSWFNVNKTTLTNSQWQSKTSDNSTFERVLFSDPTRSIETYLASLGETDSIEAFIARYRMQNRFNWDERFTTQAVTSWIKSGFIQKGRLQIPADFRAK